MFQKTTLCAAALALMTFQACSQKSANGKREKLNNGVEYVMVKDASGRTIKDGDIVGLHVSYFSAKDSLLQTSRAMQPGAEGQKAEPLKVPYQTPQQGGAWELVLTKASAGDSIVAWFPIDSIFRDPNAHMPPFLKRGDKVRVGIQVVTVQSASDMTGDEKKRLKDFASKLKGQVVELPSGLMYVVTKPGTGPKPVAGNTIQVHYTGTLLDGTKFDSSVDRGQPFEFTVGQGQVIKGWDEGLLQLAEGTKATLLIPSELGYGARGAGPQIPPYSPLVFEVELIKAKK